MCIWQFPALDTNAFNLSAAMGYIVICLNPFIYASRYEVFRRQLKHTLNMGAANPNNPGWTNFTQPAGIQH